MLMYPKRIALWIFYLMLVICASVAVWLHIYDEDMLMDLCREDGFVQWLTAIFYFFSFLVILILNKKQKFRNPWYWCFSFLFLFVAGEEISWGQRIFHIATPEVLYDINLQHEITIHNIKGIHGSIRLVGTLAVLVFCFAVPFSQRYISRLQKLYKKLKLPLYPIWASGIAALAIALMAVPRFFHSATFTMKDIFRFDEMGELYLAIVFLVFSLSEFRKHKNEK